jgi:hypothetical protein
LTALVVVRPTRDLFHWATVLLPWTWQVPQGVHAWGLLMLLCVFGSIGLCGSAGTWLASRMAHPPR